MPRGRILFIDSYDSFSNSIVALLRSELSVAVESIKIDDSRFIFNNEAFFSFLDTFDAVVAGPGPGHPSNVSDVGLIQYLWALPDEHLLPILGICLGFQSLCLAFGGRVIRLEEPRHGVTTVVTHCGTDIYTGTGKVVATQYHSLHVQLKKVCCQHCTTGQLWRPSDDLKELVPLAWSLSTVTDQPILMAARHCFKPFWGVQYHPESICTNEEGRNVIRAWWKEAWVWPLKRSFKQSPPIENNFFSLHDGMNLENPAKSTLKATAGDQPSTVVRFKAVNINRGLDVATLVEALREDDKDAQPLLLESGTRNGRPVNSETGRFSIIGLPESGAMQIRYSTDTRRLEIEAEGTIVLNQQANINDSFRYIDEVMRRYKASSGSSESPFWGGLVGFISYEAGLETIDVLPGRTRLGRPDLWFQMVERSIVLDHVDNVLYIQSIHRNDDRWINSMEQTVLDTYKAYCGSEVTVTRRHQDALITAEPQWADYVEKIRICQSHLRAGSSYELCLTDRTHVQSTTDAWSLYARLREDNPAPFSSYLRLESSHGLGISIISSSPERFLSWTRRGSCQFRPIKGTFKKTSDMTRARAEELLGSAKERAENLMIVDLIRHDLNGVKGVKQVDVTKLMTVEEYETVYQLVSVIEGELEPSTSPTSVIAASLPPGSMTGAPKKRSCELLKAIENQKPRGLYSGVMGYFDVGGGGDFSVVIRTAFKWDDQGSTWSVGAGGAITALSETEAEWNEMLTKRESILRSFF